MNEKGGVKTNSKIKGRIEIKSKAPLKTKKDISIFYTPGVGAVSSFLAKNKNQSRKLTMKLAAAKNLAALIKNPTPSKIIPSVFDKRVVKTVASAISKK